jgi:hypothetical protein
MAVISYLRGHKIEYRKDRWCYFDNGDVANYERPCKRCDRLPTPEGHDACLDYIPNVKSACCGHGVSNSIIVEKKS